MDDQTEQSFAQLADKALNQFEAGHYAESIPFANDALDFAQTHLGAEHIGTAVALRLVAKVLKAGGQWIRAKSFSQDAVALYKKLLGSEHPEVADSLRELAEVYMGMGDFGIAELTCQEALAIQQKALGPEHFHTGLSLNSLGTIYLKMGNAKDAEQLFHKALHIYEKTKGHNNPDTASCLNNLAATYYIMAKYERSDAMYQEALAITRQLVGQSHPDYAVTARNQAFLYWNMGNYSRAIRLIREALATFRNALGEEHPELVSCLTFLAQADTLIGKYARAENTLEQALAICRKVWGAHHYETGLTLNYLAMLYDIKGDYVQAEPLYWEVYAIIKESFGLEHPLTVTILYNLACLHKDKGDYTKAEKWLKDIYACRQKQLGPDHPDSGKTLARLGEVFAASGRLNDALDYFREVQRIDDTNLSQIFLFASEQQRDNYIETLRNRYDTYLSLVLRYFQRSSQVIGETLQRVLCRKAITADALATVRDVALDDRYPALAGQFKRLRTLRIQIARKRLDGPSIVGSEVHQQIAEMETYQQLLAKWTADKEELEAKLARQIPEMNMRQRLQADNRQAVAEALPSDSALVEFVRFDVFDFQAVQAKGEKQWQPARYLAFIMLADQRDTVRMIDLGEAVFIDKRIADFRQALFGEPRVQRAAGGCVTESSTTPQDGRGLLFQPEHKTDHADRDLGEIPVATTEQPSDKIGMALREAVFDPLRSALQGCTRLFLSPDGDLARLPFEVLPDGEGRRLIDGYRISYLSAGRDALSFGQSYFRPPAPPLIAADPDFDLGGKHAGERFGARHSRDLDRSQVHFNRLPGTHGEGEHLAKLLQVRPWLEGHALEGKLKQQRSPRILHLATHGFFLEDQAYDPNQARVGAQQLLGGDTLNRLAGPQLENPLLRSGIALAGANTWLKGESPPADAEDGLLTAEDVSGLDLIDTDLVVLSACDTGLGEIKTGEGVFGLRRAFVLAGAKTLVMSLWKVPDEETRELMEDFYRRLLDGQPRAEALRDAQLAMKAKHPHPLYWGAFICQGDPGPLPDETAQPAFTAPTPESESSLVPGPEKEVVVSSSTPQQTDYFSTSTKEEKIMSEELITKTNVTIELLKEIFDNAYLNTEITSEGNLVVREGRFSTFVSINDAWGLIYFAVWLGVTPGSNHNEVLEFVKQINEGTIVLRASDIQAQRCLTFDYCLWIEGGVTKKNIVLTLRGINKLVELALQNDTKGIIYVDLEKT